MLRPKQTKFRKQRTGRIKGKASKNLMLTEDLNLDYLDEKYREIFVLGKKNEVLYIINDK